MARETNRQDLYSEVTNRIIAEMEEGRLPWVQARCVCKRSRPVRAKRPRRSTSENCWRQYLQAGGSRGCGWQDIDHETKGAEFYGSTGYRQKARSRALITIKHASNTRMTEPPNRR